MEKFDFEQMKDIKDVEDISDAVKKIVALQKQINNPTRDGMINALSDAQSTAGKEIQQLEYSRGIQSQLRGSAFEIRTCIGN